VLSQIKPQAPVVATPTVSGGPDFTLTIGRVIGLTATSIKSLNLLRAPRGGGGRRSLAADRPLWHLVQCYVPCGY
jgi:hypothetical protein